MRKAWLVARRELGDLVGDRSFLLGLGILVLMPLFLVLTLAGGATRSPGSIIFFFALQSALFPSFMAVNAAAATFAQEKEAQTLLPLLAAPIRDLDIIVGKTLAILLPATAASWLALAAYDVVATLRFGAEPVASVLSPPTLLSLGALAAFLVLTLGSWAMVIASRVKTVRAAQQISGLLAGLLVAVFVAAASFITQVLDGWLLVLLPLGVLAADIVALELTRRLWQREEVIARI